MELGLKDKVAFITGASRGIGKGIARSLAKEGCKVALTATRADLLETVAKDIQNEFGVEAAWWTGDLLKTTERWTGLVQAMARDMNLSFEQADQLAPASIPLGRIAEVEEVADLVTYLASPKAHFVNGTMIEIDGGQMKPIMDSVRDRV